MERLQKYISLSGYTSRRKAEELISKGKVKVNGIVIKDDTNRTWLCCPVCGKKQFPLDGAVVTNLQITCKMCKSLFVTNYSEPAMG